MSAVTVREVVKEFETGSVRAINRVSFEVEEGELLVLLGPSGCGKTTTLRAIAGLEEPDEGQIWLGDRQVSWAERNLFVPTEKRNIGMVFQSYAIWPHMTVFDNVAYPLRVRRVARSVIGEKVNRTLALVGLEGVAARSATQLSGGQQQRVALARAIVFEPRLLLLDEPLSNLDARLRIHMRTELKHLQQQTGITSVFVTHDQAESMALADRIIVMNQGCIEQIGSPSEIYERPRSRFVSEFVGSINLLRAQVVAVGPSDATAVHLQLRYGPHAIACSTETSRASHLALEPGQFVQVSIRPEKLGLCPADLTDGRAAAANVWLGRVRTATYYGDHREYDVELDDHLLKVTTPVSVIAQPGERVGVTCDPTDIVVVSSDGTEPR